MTSTTFFIIFIPILAILLLAINLILAPHNPYQEKDSVFECGFHSFLGQNRTQFSVSFFIFGLLFLLFDLEILLVYPYSVSSYTNDIYGLVVMMVFFVLLTLGFVFELGKNALTIDSRQTSYNNVDVPTPHAFTYSLIKSSIFANIINAILSRVKRDIKTALVSYITNVIISKCRKNALYLKLNTILNNIINRYNRLLGITQFVLSIATTIAKWNCPLLYTICIFLHKEYTFIVTGSIRSTHVYFFLSLGLYMHSVDFINWMLIMVFSMRIKEYILNCDKLKRHSILTCISLYILDIIYLLAMGMCISYIMDIILLPLLNNMGSILTRLWNGVLNMMGLGESSSSKSTPNYNPSPNPKGDNKVLFADSKDKDEKDDKLKSYLTNFMQSNDDFFKLDKKADRDQMIILIDFTKDYVEYLPSTDKDAFYSIMDNYKGGGIVLHEDHSAFQYWLARKREQESAWGTINSTFQLFERNSKLIQKEMGGRNTTKSSIFRRDLNKFKSEFSTYNREKKAIISKQLDASSQLDNILKEKNVRLSSIMAKYRSK